MKKLGKNRLLHDPLILSAAILARWRRPVASGVALAPLHRAMHAVWYRRIAMAIEMASKHHALFVVFLLHATPCSRWGDK